MIARLKGKVIEKGENHLIIDTGGISYEVNMPTAVMQRLDENPGEDYIVNLVTYHYFHLEPSRSIPILIGFLNEIEKEFFEIFITVSGIGPRAALRALNKPISMIAKAIDEADIDFLRSLPGIGNQRAKEIVAKLQNKVGKFGLIKDEKVKNDKIHEERDIQDEVLDILMQLEYKKSEAMQMIRKAMERSSQIKTSQELLNEVYKQRRIG